MQSKPHRDSTSPQSTQLSPENHSKRWRRHRKKGALVTAARGVASPVTMETSTETPQKVKRRILYDPTSLLLGAHPESVSVHCTLVCTVGRYSRAC